MVVLFGFILAVVLVAVGHITAGLIVFGVCAGLVIAAEAIG